MKKKAAGRISVKITVRRLRSSLRISRPRNVRLNPPSGGRRRSTETVVVFIRGSRWSRWWWTAWRWSSQASRRGGVGGLGQRRDGHRRLPRRGGVGGGGQRGDGHRRLPGGVESVVVVDSVAMVIAGSREGWSRW